MNGDKFIIHLNQSIDYWDDVRRSCGTKSQRDIALTVRFILLEVKGAAISAMQESFLSPELLEGAIRSIPERSKPRKSQGKGKGRASQ